MPKQKKQLFSEETMASIRGLGEVLQNIHNRLIKEGYVMKDGVFTLPSEKDQV